MKRLIGRATKGLLLSAIIPTFAFAAEPEAIPGEYIVKLKDDVSVQSFSQKGLSSTLGAYVKSTIEGQNIVVVKRPVFEISSSAVKSLAQNPLVEIVEPNFIYRASKTPNDPMLTSLWGISNEGQKDSSGRNGVAGVDVNAIRAWDIQTGSRDVVVAVIDTGVNYNHPDLAPNMWVNEAEKNGQAGVDDDGNGFIDDVHGYNFNRNTADPLDDHGHGSHCAGTIGAKGDDGKGIVGVAWDVRIMAVKFLGRDGSGSLEGALRSVDYATKMGAKILSNSWGGGGASETLKAAIQRSHDAGALFVAAAGNESNNNDARPTYPATYDVPNVLSVAAIDNSGRIASFSNYGKTSVHVGAPGVNVLSSTTGSKYESYSGTSMACPHVSGVAALLASNEPGLSGVEMKQRIIATARTINGLRGKVKSGLVDAHAVLTNTVPPPDMNDPANWTSVAAAVSSEHPYKEKQTYEYEVSVEGAKEIALFFEKFDTEAGYDKVEIFDSTGKKVETLSGVNHGSFSGIITGSYAKIVFKTDDSVNKYGFDITKIAYR